MTIIEPNSDGFDAFFNSLILFIKLSKLANNASFDNL
jgi:hypothetical protein